MVSQVIAGEYVVRFLSDTEGYERGAMAVGRANQQVNRSEQKLERERQQRDQQRRRAQRQQFSGIGRGVVGRLPGGAAGLGLAGAAGFGVAGLGAAGIATAGVGAAAIGIAALGTAAVQASIELGSIQGIQLADEFSLLKQEVQLLLAEIGTALIPIIRPVVQGLTDFVRTLRQIGLLSGEQFAVGGRADVALRRDAAGRITFAGRGGAPQTRGDSEPFRISISGLLLDAAEAIGRLALAALRRIGDLLLADIRAWGELIRDGAIALGNFARDGVAALSSFAIEGLRILTGLLPNVGETAGNAANAIGNRVLRNLQDVIDLRGGSVTGPIYRHFGGGAGRNNFGQPSDTPFGFQRGGIVPATPGGILGRIGEGGQAEAIAPISDLVGIIRRALGQPGGAGGDVHIVDQFRAALAGSAEKVSLESRLNAADARMAQTAPAGGGTTVVSGGTAGLTVSRLTKPEYEALDAPDDSTLYIVQGSPITDDDDDDDGFDPGGDPTVITISAAPNRVPALGADITLTASAAMPPATPYYQFVVSTRANLPFVRIDSEPRSSSPSKDIDGFAVATTKYYRAEIWNAQTGGTRLGVSHPLKVDWGGGQIYLDIRLSDSSPAWGESVTLSLRTVNAPAGAWYQFRSQDRSGGPFTDVGDRTQARSHTIPGFAADTTKIYSAQMWSAETGGDLLATTGVSSQVRWTETGGDQ